MRQLIILLALCTIAYGQQNTKKYSILFDTPSVYALDYNGSNEYISVTPALRLTGKYSLQDDFSDGDYNGWTVSSGAYAVVDSTPLSGGTKALKCNTAGLIYIPNNQAYGSWEFDWYKGADANQMRIWIISTINTGAGYELRPSLVEKISFYLDTSTGLLLSVDNYFANNT